MKGIQTSWFMILFFVAFLPRLPASGLFGTGVFDNYLWTDIALFLLIAVLFLLKFGSRKNRLRGNEGRKRTKIELAIALLIVVQYVSLLVSVLRGDEMHLSYLLTGYIWIRALAIILAARYVVRDSRSTQRFLRWFLVGYAIVCIIGVLELLGVQVIVDFLNTTYGTEQHVTAALIRISQGAYRITSTFDRNPHGLALYTMTGTTIIISILLVVRNMRFLVRLVLIVMLGLGLLNLFVTNSRLGLLAMSASLATILLSQPTFRLGRKIVLLGIVVVATSLFQGLFQTSVALYEILFQGLKVGNMSVSGLSNIMDRYNSWSVVGSLITRRLEWLLVGVGPNQYERYAKNLGVFADSDYVMVLFTVGVVGLLLYILLLGIILHGVFGRYHENPGQSTYTDAVLLAVKGVLVGFIVSGFAGPFMTSSAFDRNSFFFYSLIGIAIALKRGDNEIMYGNT